MSMPPMLAYTVHAYLDLGRAPIIVISQGLKNTFIKPANPADGSYWIAILDANNPLNKVTEFIVPSTNNATVPAGLDTYMSNPKYLFAVATQSMSNAFVPQGDFYDYLAAHGAGTRVAAVGAAQPAPELRIDLRRNLYPDGTGRAAKRWQPGLRDRHDVRTGDAGDVAHAVAERTAALLALRQLHVRHAVERFSFVWRPPSGGPREVRLKPDATH